MLLSKYVYINIAPSDALLLSTWVQAEYVLLQLSGMNLNNVINTALYILVQ